MKKGFGFEIIEKDLQVPVQCEFVVDNEKGLAIAIYDDGCLQPQHIGYLQTIHTMRGTKIIFFLEDEYEIKKEETCHK